MTYTKRVERDADFETVLEETIAAIEDEGFGVITDVDVQATMREKLDESMNRYRILGACAPDIAFDGLQIDADLGALLPCNVVVRETDAGTTVVSAVDPVALVSITENPEIEAVIEDADRRLDRVIGAIEG